MTKCNTTAPIHIGLRIILACCSLQPLSSDEEEEKENKNKKEKEEGEA